MDFPAATFAGCFLQPGGFLAMAALDPTEGRSVVKLGTVLQLSTTDSRKIDQGIGRW